LKYINQYNFVFYAWANNKTNNAWNYRSHHQEILWQLSASYEKHTIQKLKQFYCKTKKQVIERNENHTQKLKQFYYKTKKCASKTYVRYQARKHKKEEEEEEEGVPAWMCF